MARNNDVSAAAPALAYPPYPWIWAALVFAIGALSLGYPALFGEFLVNPYSDQFKAGYAFREFAAASLKSGQGFPLWNPYLLGGLPYVAAMHGDIFYPTFLLRMVMRTDQAMTWEFIIHLFVAGLGTYAFLRTWRLSFAASLIGGIAYMLSGPIAAYASPGHDGKLFVSALLPLALLCLVRGVRDGRAWAWGAFSLVVGLGVLSPHPQLLQYMLLACGAFALFLAFGSHDNSGRLPRDVAIKRLAFAFGAVVLGLAIGAVQFLPVREYVPWSPRVGGRGYEFATSFSMPIEELVNVIVPQFSGILRDYWGRNGIHLHSEYAGAAVVMLAVAAAGGERLRSLRWFWIGAFVVSLLWTLGGSTPFYHIVYAIVPGTKFFRAPSTMMYVTMFSVAVLAGMGAQHVLERRTGSRYLIAWLAVAGVLTLLATSGGFTNLARSIATSFDPSGQRDEDITRNGPALVFGTLRSVAVLLATAGLIWATVRERITVKVAGWALAALVAVDLWTVERMYWTFSPPAAKLFASDPAIEAIKRAPQPGRVIVLDAVGRSGADPVFLGDGLMPHRVRTLLGYHGNELGRFELLLGKTVPDIQYPIQPQFDAAVWRHENVHYLYTTVPDSLVSVLQSQLGVSGQWTKVVGPVTNAAGTTVYLYRLPGENPYAWLAPVMVKAADEQARATVLDPRFDPTRAAIVAPDANVPAVQVQSLPPAAEGRVTVQRYEPGAVDLTLDRPATAGQALVVSENYFPGWRAIADGKDAPAARMNYNLIGIALPAGARTVQLRFDDAAFETGKLVSLVAVALAIALWLGGALLGRRSVAPTAVPA